MYLYFSLDNGLPAGGYIKIDFPENFNHIPATCNVWKITTDLKYPTTTSNIYPGTIIQTDNTKPVFYCSLKSDLTDDAVDQGLEASIAYGMSLEGNPTVVEGSYAPIGL